MNHEAVGDTLDPEPIDQAAADAAPPPPPPPHITLELALPPAFAERLWRAPALAALRAGRTRSAKLRITWHDSADGRLAEGGRTLARVEQGRASHWLTQAARRDGDRLWPLATVPDGQQAADPAGLPDMPDRPLLPVAVLEGRRRSLRLPPDQDVAEFALLDGVLVAGPDRADVARLCCRGRPAAVFALVRALLTQAPLSVPSGPLGTEVLRHLHGETPPPAPRLHDGLDLDDAFAHVISQLGAALVHHAPGARAAATPDPVHQMRVALRRLRSALSLFRRVAGSPELDRARQDLGELARALGPARDWDVFLSGTGRDVAKLLPTEPALARLNAAATRRRKASYAALARLLDGPDFQRILLDLSELAARRPWRDAAAPEQPRLIAFARHALDRKLRRVTDAGDDLSPLPIEALHATRIRCKRLRYAAEFFAPLEGGRHSRRFLRRLAAVQERLGHLNDGAVAAELLGQLGAHGFAAGIVHGYIAARTQGERAKAERSWRKFLRTEPFWT